MGDQQLSAPAECSSVQDPQSIHNPLFDDFVKAVRENGNKVPMTITPTHDVKAELTTSDGNRFEAVFEAIFSGDRAYGMSLVDLRSSKADQHDSYGVPWRNLSKNWTVREKTIDLDGQPQEPGRSHVSGIVKGHNGSVSYDASLNEDKKTVRSETGFAYDLSGNQISQFAYTFDPDGKATMCAKSITTGGKPDHIVWSMKVE